MPFNQHVRNWGEWRLHENSAVEWDRPEQWTIRQFVQRNLGPAYSVIGGGTYAMTWAEVRQ